MFRVHRSSMISKALFASFAVTTVTKSPAICQEPVWSSKGLGLPNFATINPKLLKTTIDKELESFKVSLDNLNKSISRTSVEHPDSVVFDLEKVGMPLFKNWGVVSLYYIEYECIYILIILRWVSDVNRYLT